MAEQVSKKNPVFITQQQGGEYVVLERLDEQGDMLLVQQLSNDADHPIGKPLWYTRARWEEYPKTLFGYMTYHQTRFFGRHRFMFIRHQIPGGA
jgi:hypothetical protein